MKRAFFVKAIWMACLMGWAGATLAALPAELKLTDEGKRHIEERHVRLDTFPFKSKFTSGFDYVSEMEVVFRQGKGREEPGGRIVFDYDTGRVVGRRGQTALRLVIERDGTVVTFYPIFKKDIGE